MGKTVKYLILVIVTAAMAGVYACGEEAPPPSRSRVVKQKIAGQQTRQPETPAASQTAAAAKAPASAQPETPKGPGDDADTAGSRATSELVRESMAIAGGYDPKGRFDPFEPLFKDEPNAPKTSQSKDKRKRRVPQTPLERIAISQLKLSAIMRTSKGNSAIVEDAGGKGYVIRKGTYIGLNSGQVIRVDKNHVVIEEEIENVMGELIIQNTELKLQKPAGEL